MLHHQNLSPSTIPPSEFADSLRKIIERIPFQFAKKPANGQPFRVGIACSGGADSTALTHLAVQALGKERVHLFTVNHNLPGLAEEPVEQIEKLVSTCFPGVQHTTLTLPWSEKERQTTKKAHLQHLGRQKRYSVLYEAVKAADIPFLLTGHLLDDDWITHCHRAARFSCLDGIAGIKPLAPFPVEHSVGDEALLLRPLLHATKAQMLATCTANNLPYLTDAGNSDMEFARNSSMAALNQIHQKHGELGITAERIYAYMQRQKAHRALLQKRLLQIIPHSVLEHSQEGTFTICLNNSKWIHQTPLLWRLLNYSMQAVGCQHYPPSSPISIQQATKLQAAYEEWNAEQRKERAKVPRHLLAQFSTADSALWWQTRRLDFNQSTLANSSIYPLTSTDAIARLRDWKHKNKVSIPPGPCLMIAPSKKPKSFIQEQQTLVLGQQRGNIVNWANRFQLKINFRQPMPASAPRTLVIGHLTLDKLKALQAEIRRGIGMANVFRWVSCMPSQFFSNWPIVMDAEDKAKFAIPHLEFYSAHCDFEVQSLFLGSGIFRSKLLY
jgi:tRNA(Ile)-lysidine synthetase-like protein